MNPNPEKTKLHCIGLCSSPMTNGVSVRNSSFAAFTFLFSFILLIGSERSFARQWYVEPSVSISLGHLTNPELMDTAIVASSGEDEILETPAFDETQSEDQTFTEIGANFSFISETAVDSLVLDVAASGGEYSDEIYDTESALLDLSYEKTGARTDYQYGISYSEESSFDSELEDSGIFLTGLTRETLGGSIGVVSRFSERWTNQFELGYEDVSFSGGVDSIVDFRETRISLTSTRIASERLSFSLGGTFLAFRPENTPETLSAGGDVATDQDSLALRLGLTYQLSPRSTLDLSIDPTYVDAGEVEEAGAESIDSTEDSIGYSAIYVNRGLSDTFTVSFTSAQESTSLGGITETTGAGVSWAHSFSERVSTLASYDRVERDAVAETPSSVLTTVSLGATWMARRNTEVDLEFSNRRREETGIFTSDATSNLFQVTLRYNFNRSRTFGSN